MLSYKPATVRAPGASPLSRSKTYAVLKDIAARAETAEVIVSAAKAQASKAGAAFEPLEDACAKEMRQKLLEAEVAAAAAHDVSVSDLQAAWRYFSQAYDASLEEEDGEGDENDAEEGEEEGPSVRAVVRAGWAIKRASASLLMNGQLLMEVMQTMGAACERAVPVAFVRLQAEFDAMGVSDMPPGERQRVVVAKLQALQPAVVARGEERIIEEFGVTKTELASVMSRWQRVDPSIPSRANAALATFQTSLQREVQALAASMSLA